MIITMKVAGSILPGCILFLFFIFYSIFSLPTAKYNWLDISYNIYILCFMLVPIAEKEL